MATITRTGIVMNTCMGMITSMGIAVGTGMRCRKTASVFEWASPWR
jgi:hypothetical protein